MNSRLWTIHLNHGPPVPTMMEQRACGQPAVAEKLWWEAVPMCLQHRLWQTADGVHIGVAASRVRMARRGRTWAKTWIETAQRRSASLQPLQWMVMHWEMVSDVHTSQRARFMTSSISFGVARIDFKLTGHRRSKLFRNRTRFACFYILHIVI